MRSWANRHASPAAWTPAPVRHFVVRVRELPPRRVHVLREDTDPRLTVHRRACPAGQLCTVGYFPNGTPNYRYVWCFDDLGADPRCTGQIGFCGDHQPFACQDGHALSSISQRCPIGSDCGFDTAEPGTWPTCLGDVTGLPRPPKQCEDLGDAASVCANALPPCTDSGTSPCFTSWHVAGTCCDPQGTETDRGKCTGAPFRQVDGSIELRLGGFVACLPIGGPSVSWCCTSVGSP